MEEYKRVYITQDDDGHNYIMPYELKESFDDLLALTGDDEDDWRYNEEFEERFSQYNIGGSIDNEKLYIKTNK